jgi:hypothetical protein
VVVRASAVAGMLTGAGRRQRIEDEQLQLEMRLRAGGTRVMCSARMSGILR